LSRVGFGRSDMTATIIEVAEDLEKLAEPFSGYSDLTVKEIQERLDNLDEEMLRSVRAYEAGTKKRVTLLREIDERLAGIESN